jgi:hypothetical protein
MRHSQGYIQGQKQKQIGVQKKWDHERKCNIIKSNKNLMILYELQPFQSNVVEK